ncbi:MAG: hypothetical protein A2W61_06515 [Deltaproteobacteria bacterium RIFCSPLOWO2_01_44_7]|nr:MAG: hypothetical protein A2712_03835 [Deltaproteobacteria bacterium RIFCSPHIGHO2_01_FULL_43_49]OGQ16318.1 MAG: hypothetical protein A3D22_01805 [Deltaproteobacteria bacterium RIFCSPHIGHO2_02_FULL_44_53]OGQ29278.1 MAG: hypothetical protein A3D98_05590 [Deltaproteobacteria bacterium RIFCSPHIGHO2_12_FULL_44_21]OGQ32835.1 MAG: hypothetical protein A2979_09735 [Deltaproteobacteria bacterium RIFCSPLOWO2_01_FULL_45_74]OGQ40678.1 MAG: hypothetical protein A2W61_06515 [Deltaproteobacteria bacterium 
MVGAGQNTIPLKPVVFRQGEDPARAFEEIRKNVLKRLGEELPKAFPRYAPQQSNFTTADSRLLSDDNLRAAIFPRTPLTVADIPTISPKIKQSKITEQELKAFGVVGSYTKIRDKEEVDLYDVYLHASLFVLPTTLPTLRDALDHPETFKDTRPNVNDSGRCFLPTQEAACYLKVGAFRAGGTMVLANEYGEASLIFHRHPFCTDSAGNVFVSENVPFMDGLKLYQPILFEKENGDQEERTLSLANGVTIWEGLAGWVMSSSFLAPHERQRTTFASGGGLNEILAVLKYKQESANRSAIVSGSVAQNAGAKTPVESH